MQTTTHSTDTWQPTLCPTCGAHVLLADGGIWQCQNVHCGARWLDKEPATAQADDTPGNDCPDHGPYADDDCPKCAFPLCRACTTAEYPPSAMQSAFCIECVNAMLHGQRNRFAAAQHAQTLQSIAIESRLTVCGYCQGIHHIQHCPELGDALLAERWIGAELGRLLCQMRWRNHAGFVALLSEATAARLVEYAQSYLAFIHDYNPASLLTVPEVLTAWGRALGHHGPALERAA